MNFLVTGGAGFIGSNLTNYLLQQGHCVAVIDDLSTGNLNNLKTSDLLSFIEGSVTDYDLMETILSTHEFDYIFHLAAIASVADSVLRPIETHEINFLSVMYILDLIKKHQPNLKRLVFSSSAAVYGDDPQLPKTEEMAINPLTPYAVDKYAAEKILLNGTKLYGIKTSVVRFFNVYGPKQNPTSEYSGVISILLKKFNEARNTPNISFDLFGDGNQTRDFVYVDDVIKGLILVSEKAETVGHFYNIGTAVGTSLNEVISALTELFQVSINITYRQARNGDIRHSRASIDKLNQLGFLPAYNITQGLTKLLKDKHS